MVLLPGVGLGAGRGRDVEGAPIREVGVSGVFVGMRGVLREDEDA